jgi:hypothetical protein
MNAPATTNFDGDYAAESGPRFAPARSRFDPASIMQSIRNFASVSEALRILGASVLLASMSLFLLQGWDDGNDIRRYLMLLAQTGLLAVGGFALSHGLKEAKGARLFFGLALVSVPANFTILGALLYSVFQWDGALTTYPEYATWQFQDVASIGITLAGAMLVLLPVTMFAFAIMARHSAKGLSLHFFALNALLLLPVRSSVAAGAVALIGIAYALAMVRRVVGQDKALKTAEGRFALSTLFIPAGIILFRSMYFYQVDSLMVAMLALAAFLAARQASTLPGRGPRIALGLEMLSAPIAFIFAVATTDAASAMVGWALTAPVFALAYTLPALDLVYRTQSRVLAKCVGVSISLFVAVAFVLNVSGNPSALQAFLALTAGVLMFISGVSLRKSTASVAGVVTIVASLMFGFEAMLAVVLTSSWIDLAIFGAFAIAAGSVLDRHGVAMKLKITNWIASLRQREEVIVLDD